MKLRKAFGLVFFCLFSTAFAAEKPNVKTSSVATLNSLRFSPSFTRTTVAGPDFRDYTATVPYSVSSIQVIPITTDPAATVKVNGVTVISGSLSSGIFLGIGNNTVITTVTASDGITSNTYKITITRQASNIATLNSLKYTPGITPTVVTGADFRDYTASVSSTVTSIKVTPLATDPAAVVRVKGIPVTYGSASVSIPLNVGANTITTVVTAPDGITTKTYRIIISRDAPPVLSSLLFDPSVTKTTITGIHFRDYTAMVPNTVTSVKVIPTAATSLLTIKVNGTPVASGAASASIPLSFGENTITTVVTEADGVTTNTYSTVITRQKSAVATLNSLSFSPRITKTTVSGPDFRDYTATVASTVNSISVNAVATDPGATIVVNNQTVVSGTYSQPIPLSVGSNTITTTVIAADGVSKNVFKTVITRMTSNNANLSEAKFDFPGDQIYTQNAQNIYYNLVPTPNVTGVYVTVSPQDNSAGVKVNGVAVNVNQPSQRISLQKGWNTITITITASDGVTTKTYKTPVFLPVAMTFADLSLVDPATPLTKILGIDLGDYIASVPNSVSSIKILFHTTDTKFTTVTINGIPEQSGVKSGPFALAVGKTTIKIVITAYVVSASSVYEIVITRAAPPVAHVMAYTEDKQQSPIATGVVVHANLSPNGDGVGDKLLIDGVAAYPDNKLMIMNRSGALVYQANGYDNILKVFDGHSSVNGKLQQAGTYFYSFDYKADGVLIHKTGYIIIKY